MKRRLCLMFLLALLSAFAGAPAEGEGAELTLMIYMCGSNLESQYASAGSDLEEIAASGVDAERVNAVTRSVRRRIERLESFIRTRRTEVLSHGETSTVDDVEKNVAENYLRK